MLTYWTSCIVGTYIVRNGNKQKQPFPGKTPLRHHIAIVLIIPVCMPFVLLYSMFRKCRKSIYRNRPRPIPKKLRGGIKKDIVIDENGGMMSIAEYNRKHGTSFTLQDVYGKSYSYIQDDLDVKPSIRIQEGIPKTPHYYAAKKLGESLLGNDLSSFGEMLADNALIVLNRSRTIRGKAEIITYWEGYFNRWVETGELRDFTVKQCNYYINACLEMKNMYVLFHFTDGLVSEMLLTPKNIDQYHIGWGAMFDTLPYSLAAAKEFFQELSDEATSDPNHFMNRTPCLCCGCESDQLEWHGTSIREGIHGYIGEMSVCPHCGKVVEYLPLIRIRYDDTVNQEEDYTDLPF